MVSIKAVALFFPYISPPPPCAKKKPGFQWARFRFCLLQGYNWKQLLFMVQIPRFCRRRMGKHFNIETSLESKRLFRRTFMVRTILETRQTFFRCRMHYVRKQYVILDWAFHGIHISCRAESSSFLRLHFSSVTVHHYFDAIARTGGQFWCIIITKHALLIELPGILHHFHDIFFTVQVLRCSYFETLTTPEHHAVWWGHYFLHSLPKDFA